MKRVQLFALFYASVSAMGAVNAQAPLPAPRALGASTGSSDTRVVVHGSMDGGVVARELSDGRVVVLRDDSTVVLFDSTLHESRRVGRLGDYGTLPQVWAGLADTTFMAPWIGGVFTVIDPAGKIVNRGRAITIPNDAKWLAGGPPGGRLDDAGRFLILRETQPLPSDSAGLTWVDFRGHHEDVPVTVRSRSRSGAPDAFDAIDANDIWAGLGDGTVMVMRGATCQVEVVAPGGRRTIQPPIACPRKTPPSARVRERLASVMTSYLAPQWYGYEPAYMPTATIVAPDGRVWIERNPFLQDNPYGDVVYDILDRSGKIVDAVAIPAGNRVAGIGSGVIYLVRFSDGRLNRVRQP